MSIVPINVADCGSSEAHAIEINEEEILGSSMGFEKHYLSNIGLKITRDKLRDKPDFSPFSHALYPTKTCYGLFKIILFTVTLVAPLRLLIYFFLELINVAIACLAGCGISQTSPRECWRKPLIVWMVLNSRLKLLIFGYYWIPITGKLEKDSRVIIANHVAIVDRMLIKWMCFWNAFSLDPSFIAKRSLKGTPLGILGKCELTIWVDKTSYESRQATKEAISTRAKDKRMPRLLVFAEGTTSSPNSLLIFKTGAFLPGVPVAPVCLSLLNKTGGGMQEMSFRSLLDDFYFPLCNFVNYARVDILPTYYPNEREQSDPVFFAENVRLLLYKELCKYFTSVILSPIMTDDVRVRYRSLQPETREQLDEFYLSDLFEKIGLKTYKTILFVDLYDELSLQGRKLSLEDFQRILQATHTKKQAEYLFQYIKFKLTGAVGLLQFILFFAVVEGSAVESVSRVNDILYFAFASLFDFDKDIPSIRRSHLEEMLGANFGAIWGDLDRIGAVEFFSRGGRNEQFLEAAHKKVYQQFLEGFKLHAPNYYSHVENHNKM
jgi:lysophosphatidylcholine acyltransferase/lyso-PAF acetyltransferase